MQHKKLEHLHVQISTSARPVPARTVPRAPTGSTSTRARVQLVTRGPRAIPVRFQIDIFDVSPRTTKTT